MTKKIEITCEYTDLVPIDDLVDFQGELKKLTDEEYEKLENSIVRYGFSFPVFTWKKHIMDGHQRLKVVKGMIASGDFEMEKIPIVRIIAKNKKEAAEKLLVLNSQYAQIQQTGFDAFINNFKVDLKFMEPVINLVDIDFTPLDLAPGKERDTESEIENVNVAVDPPKHKVDSGDFWLIGERHVLGCCNISDQWPQWMPYLNNDDVLFLPYASIFVFLSKKADKHSLLVIQPDTFLCGKMLDIYVDMFGKESVSKL